MSVRKLMEKILVSIPQQLAARMRTLIPGRQRSKIIANLIAKEVNKREKALYECAKAIEADQNLCQEMAEWEEATLTDGIDFNESW